MRRLTLTLALAALSLAFAPAPWPKLQHPSRQVRAMRECEARLRTLGTRWKLGRRDGAVCVRYDVQHPTRRHLMMGGELVVVGGDLLGALRKVVRETEEFAKRDR